MSKSQIQIEMRNIESKLQDRYSLWSRLFLLFSIILVAFIVAIILGILFFEHAYNWAGFSLEGWTITVSVLFFLFIIFELVFYYHFSAYKNKRIDLEKPQPEFIDGKIVHVYTFPKGIEGGIFSKTYIEIDKHNILRLRTLMIPPSEL